MKKLIALAAAGVMMMSCFAACGSDDDDSSGSNKCIGKWACSEFDMNGKSMPNVMPLDAMLQIEFKSDGTFFAGSSGSLQKQGTWEAIDNDTVKATADGGASVINGTKEIDFGSDSFTVEGSASGYTGSITFKRVDEFPTMNANDQLGGLVDALKGLGG